MLYSLNTHQQDMKQDRVRERKIEFHIDWIRRQLHESFIHIAFVYN